MGERTLDAMILKRRPLKIVEEIPGAYDAAPVFLDQPPSFTKVREKAKQSSHCFSTCLYREPLYETAMPKRNFKARYLDTASAISATVRRYGFGLKIFADAEMLETALSFAEADVYLVDSPVAFPFAQHNWRYYAVLLDDASIKAYHFRGLDNTACKREEIKLLRRFLAGGFDVLHAPYMRARGRVYTPVRGSCSVAGKGISTMRSFLINNAPGCPPGPWPATWHNDEIFLGYWFRENEARLKLYTYLDRAMPDQFFELLNNDLKRGVVRQIESGRVLGRGPKDS